MTVPKIDISSRLHSWKRSPSSHEPERQRSAECEDVLGFACSKSGLSGNLLQGAAIPLKGLVEVAFLPLCFVSYI